ncbi:hypothetical protein DBB36_13780 [Flavobacterium sp. WLB]|nr:hypothetical protein AKO67_16610 [Flavobacterium sp. VMW]OWU89434.1 hypothetical protein APR43_16775 [Flavobacterium sp. NLM]PUU69417.1 hypothetical protein DBB36_13780 [Flavobacterium sp. WLB]
MKNTIYKSLLLSLLITNIWSVVIFFIYYFDSPGLFSGFRTLGVYLWSCWISSGLGVLVFLLSFLRIWKSNQSKVFFLILFDWLNIFFSITFVLTTCFEIMAYEGIVELYLFTNFIISIVIFFRARRIIKTTI